MESAPINVNVGLERRRQLLAKLMAQGQAGGAAGRPGMAGFRAGVLGGRGFHNASDLMAAPLPAINMGFRPAHGIIPGGFQNDPTSPLASFPGQGQGGPPGFTPPPFQGASAPSFDPPGGGGEAGGFQQAPQQVAPASYGGPIRSFTGYTGPLDEAPDPWSVFRRSGSRSVYAI